MNIEDFYTKSKQLCSFLETIKTFDLQHLKKLINELLTIYQMSLSLPEIEPDSSERSEFQIERLHISFSKYDTYWEIYNPYENDDVVCGSLADDFADIYHEIKAGILLFENGNENDAVWHWKWSFDNHCSCHAVDALRALNQIMLEYSIR